MYLIHWNNCLRFFCWPCVLKASEPFFKNSFSLAQIVTYAIFAVPVDEFLLITREPAQGISYHQLHFQKWCKTTFKKYIFIYNTITKSFTECSICCNKLPMRILWRSWCDKIIAVLLTTKVWFLKKNSWGFLWDDF